MMTQIGQNIIEIATGMNDGLIDVPFTPTEQALNIISDDNIYRGKIFIRKPGATNSAFLKEDAIQVIKLSGDFMREINHNNPHLTYNVFQYVAATVTQKNGFALCVYNANISLDILKGYDPNGTFGDLTLEDQKITLRTINLYIPRGKEISLDNNSSLLDMKNTLIAQRNTFIKAQDSSTPYITHNVTVLKTWAGESQYKSRIIQAVRDLKDKNESMISSRLYK